MSVATVARPNSLRDIPWATWVLLALAALVLVRGFTQPVFAPIGTLTFVAPLLFAAAVVYVTPADRRFTWGAVLLAVAPAVVVITSWLPDAWFAVAPGDWKNATPLLQDLGQGAREVARLIGFIGLALLGVALGGVRRPGLWAGIIGVGVVIATVSAIWVLDPLNEGLPTLVLASSIALPTLYAVGWAFVFAAALESRRTRMLVGTGLIFAIIALGYVPQLWQGPPGTRPEALFVALACLSLVGWALVIIATLRGELTADRPASPQ